MRIAAVALLLVGHAAACGGGEAEPVVPDAPPGIPDARVFVERPQRLSESRLYADFASRTVSAEFEEFTPAYVLWSDAATKHRWVRLPPGTSIDKSDPDHWQFPVGTQLFKEFSRDGKRLETRLIERTGPGPMDYWMGAFVWAEDDSDATYAPDGALNIRGTDHDAPSSLKCWSCHTGEPGRILGYSAVQLGGLAPGDGDVAKALGYLHANCGHCHNDNGIARPDTDQILRLSLAETTPESTAIYRTTIGVKLTFYRSDPEVTMRIVAGDPEHSALFTRMSVRGDGRQMPPLATEHVDEDGAALIRAWIGDL